MWGFRDCSERAAFRQDLATIIRVIDAAGSWRFRFRAFHRPLLAVMMAFGVACTGAASGGSGSPTTSPSTTASAAPGTAPEEATLVVRSAGYDLVAPIQRSVAVWNGGVIYIAGGLDAADTTVGGVFSMNPTSGHLTPLYRVASLGPCTMPRRP